MFAPVVLDGITAALFGFFALLLVRSAPSSGADTAGESVQTDGGLAAPDSPVDFEAPTAFGRTFERFGSFVPIFAMMAAGEFGDKTQLVTIGLAVQYGAHPGIWAGEMLAIIPVSLANAYFFHRFSHRFDVRKAHLAGAALFGFFALDTVLAITTGVSAWETLVSTAADAVLALL
jgi:putative Ca2+/H+ antiporter (TMEM165/GDT1 family)